MGKISHRKHHQITAETNSTTAADNQAVEFIQHVHELRNRIFWVVLLFIIASALAYQYRDILIHLVLSPLGSQKLIFLTPAGGFSFIFQITMYAGAVVAAPVLVFQLYKFVTPALPVNARKHAALVFIAAFLLMCAGIVFGYLVAVPAALSFLTTFAGSYVNASLTADSYLSFIIAYSFGLGALFQLPLLLIFWHWIKPLTPKQLLNSERYMIIIVVIAAAIITPTPDLVNQMIIAGPIIFVYQIGVVAILFMIRSERKRSRYSVRSVIPRDTIAEQVSLASLVLPSIEELVPHKRSIVSPASRTISTKNISLAIPKAVATQPIRPRVISPMITARPSLGLSRQPYSRRIEVMHQPRPTISPRPVAQVSRQRAVSLDGFVVSS